MRRLIPVVLFTVMLAACGGKTSPTSPSSGGSASMATISGTVQAPGTSAAVYSTMAVTGRAAAFPGVTVSVVGTSISTTADGSGRFSLQNVPPGSVQLHITAPGTDATVPLSDVQASQSVDVVITVSGSTATVESDVRNSGGDGELEGRVEALPPATPALSFKAAGRTVTTDANTTFIIGSATNGAFTDLEIGERVHVKGHVSGDTFAAASVEIQNTNTGIPVEINGVVDTLTGSSSAFQFKIGSHEIHGDSTTAFFGDGDTPDTFSDLKNGVRVEVKGEQRNDYVFAARIHVNGTDDGSGDGQDSSASIHGTLKSISGSKPALTLMVDSTTVTTTSSTQVRRRGDVQTLDDLKAGQSLHVEGQRQSDGSIVARMIQIDDDPAGGEFEIEGPLGGLNGTCPSITFTVNGFLVKTSTSTTFDGGACSSLKSGNMVDVKGTRNADGSVAATTVKKE